MYTNYLNQINTDQHRYTKNRQTDRQTDRILKKRTYIRSKTETEVYLSQITQLCTLDNVYVINTNRFFDLRRLCPDIGDQSSVAVSTDGVFEAGGQPGLAEWNMVSTPIRQR